MQLTPSNYYSTEVKELLLAKAYFDGAKILFNESQKEKNQSKTFSNTIYPCLFLLQQSLELSLKAHLQVIMQNLEGFESDIKKDIQINKKIYRSHELLKVMEEIKKATQDSSNHDHERLLEYKKLFQWFDDKPFKFRFIRDNNGKELEFHKNGQSILPKTFEEVEEVINLLQNGYFEFNFYKKDLGFFDKNEKKVIHECLQLLKKLSEQFTPELTHLEDVGLTSHNISSFELNPHKDLRTYLKQRPIDDVRKALAGYYLLNGGGSCSETLITLETEKDEHVTDKLIDKLYSLKLHEIEAVLCEISHQRY